MRSEHRSERMRNGMDGTASRNPAHGSRVKTAEGPDRLLSAQIKMIKPEHCRKATSRLPSAVKILVDVFSISAKTCFSQKLAHIFLRLSPRDPQLEELPQL